MLIDHESRSDVALDLGLPSVGILTNWIRNFQKNDYNVIDKPIGRPRKMDCKNKKVMKNIQENYEYQRITCVLRHNSMIINRKKIAFDESYELIWQK